MSPLIAGAFTGGNKKKAPAPRRSHRTATVKGAGACCIFLCNGLFSRRPGQMLVEG